jgi:hypothetical protein
MKALLTSTLILTAFRRGPARRSAGPVRHPRQIDVSQAAYANVRLR